MRFVLPMRLRRLLRGEGGFTMVEVVVGIFLVSVGLMAVASSFDVLRVLAGKSSNRSVASHVADQELEQLASMSWKDLELATTPFNSTNPKNPNSGVVDSPPRYTPDPSLAVQALVIDTDASPTAIPLTRTWSEAGVSGTVYRFVTKSADAACGATCPKRLTVAVTVNQATGNPSDPVTASTVVSETQDKHASETSTPQPQPGPSNTTFFLTDTRATSIPIGTRQPTVDHVLKDAHKFPDLMVTTPPPNPSAPAAPPPVNLYDSANRAVAPAITPYTAAGYPGGRVIKAEGNCDNITGDKTKVQWWVTTPLAATMTLTGNLGGSIYAQIAGETAGNVILCLTVYDVSKALKPTGEWGGTNSTDLTKLNGLNCAADGGFAKRMMSDPEPFPNPPGIPLIEPRALNFSGTYLGCNIASQQIAAGHRLGIALTVRDKLPKAEPNPDLAVDVPAETAVVLYDHFDYPSSLTIETTTPFVP